MTTGLEIFNDIGNTILDADTENFVLAAKGTCTLSGTPTGFTTPTVLYNGTINVTANCPILALTANGPINLAILASSLSGNNWTFFVSSTNASNGAVVSYYLFDQASNNTPADNFGLEIFNAAGKLVYHTSQSPLRIVDVMNGTSHNNTYTPGRTMAVAQMSYSAGVSVSGPFGGKFTHIATYSTFSVAGNLANSLSTIYQNVQNTSSAGAIPTQGVAQYLVVDVTNF